MEAVILAAGRGARLDGIAAPFHKPLIVMNGESLVGRAARQAFAVGCERVTVVAAPENALVLSQVLPEPVRIQMIVQRKPFGPGDALTIGSNLSQHDMILVLMGDNFTPDDEVTQIAQHEGNGTNVIGVELKRPQDVSRFTYREHDGTWVEKQEPSGLLPAYTAWVGPLRLSRDDWRKACRRYGGATCEYPIGPLLNFIPRLHCINVTTIDVGVPEVLQ